MPPWSTEELLARYGVGERDFRGIRLVKANLRLALLRDANLCDADLRDANLCDANLSNAYLNNVVFSSADLKRANLSDADLLGAHLVSADLSRAQLIGAHLIGADLSRALLTGAYLRSADLLGAHLIAADLTGADLSGTNLSGADLSGANLRGANLSEANLRSACLVGTDLRGAHLGDVDLSDANLRGAHLIGADLRRATIHNTHLLDLDLSPFVDASPPVTHGGASTVDYRSILLSVYSPNLRDFLQRTGMPEVFVEYMVDCALSLKTDVFKMMQSTFISYGHPDESFARKLYEALHRNGVTTFFFPEHAIPGKKIGRTMREGVNKFDRVILICSERSLMRTGVLAEIEHTLSREDREGGASYLIPVVLDDYLFSGWKPASEDVALAVKERVAADFRGSDKDDAKFNDGLRRLITALRKPDS